jgi:hypothetical protein
MTKPGYETNKFFERETNDKIFIKKFFMQVQQLYIKIHAKFQSVF